MYSDPRGSNAGDVNDGTSELMAGQSVPSHKSNSFSGGTLMTNYELPSEVSEELSMSAINPSRESVRNCSSSNIAQGSPPNHSKPWSNSVIFYMISVSFWAIKNIFLVYPNVRYWYLMRRGAESLSQYQNNGPRDEADRAILCFKLAPPYCLLLGKEHKATVLFYLAWSHEAKYKFQRGMRDNQAAIINFREALLLQPSQPFVRLEARHKLVNCLLDRHERDGDLQDLEGATQCCIEALRLCPTGDPD
ncbi:hypothetical protein FRC03_000846 [Tulasnella sp. 419]|nr:hypothetical protein FRC03_000846 [Tulasnella sp. 419]